MVLVDTGLRRGGIGTALMTHVLRHLEERGVRSVRLDATPLGRPVYEKLGFVAEYELARYRGVPGPVEAVSGVETAGPESLPELIELDRTVSGTDRAKLLRRRSQEHPDSIRAVRRDGSLQGFL